MKKTKSLNVGEFHFIHDGSLTGHPGLIVWKDDEKNLYLAIKVGTTPNIHNFPFSKALGDNVEQSYIYKRLFIGKRKDYDRRSLPNMQMSDEEINSILETTDFSNPVLSNNLNRKDKRYFFWIIKCHKKIPFIRGNCQGTKPLRDNNNIHNTGADVNNKIKEFKNEKEKQ